jgi:hypothetical protein
MEHHNIELNEHLSRTKEILYTYFVAAVHLCCALMVSIVIGLTAWGNTRFICQNEGAVVLNPGCVITSICVAVFELLGLVALAFLLLSACVFSIELFIKLWELFKHQVENVKILFNTLRLWYWSRYGQMVQVDEV